MLGRIRWTSHKGEKILYTDLNRLKDEQLNDGIAETMNLLNAAAQQGDTYILLLVNLARIKVPEQVSEEFAGLPELRQRTTLLTAIVGLQGLPNTIVNWLLPDIELVDTITEGKDWLVKEASKL